MTRRMTALLLALLLLALPTAWVGASYYQQLTLKASGAVSATAGSTGVDLVKAVFSTDNRHKGVSIAVYLNITAISDSPTLDVKIQCSPDNTTWYDPASTSSARDSYAFAQKSGTGQDVKILAMTPCRYIREHHTFGGSGTITYSVVAEVVGGDARQIGP